MQALEYILRKEEVPVTPLPHMVIALAIGTFVFVMLTDWYVDGKSLFGRCILNSISWWFICIPASAPLCNILRVRLKGCTWKEDSHGEGWPLRVGFSF